MVCCTPILWSKLVTLVTQCLLKSVFIEATLDTFTATGMTLMSETGEMKLNGEDTKAWLKKRTDQIVRETVQSSLSELLGNFEETCIASPQCSHSQKAEDNVPSNMDAPKAISSLIETYKLQIESAKHPFPPIVHDISFLDMSMFTPGCIVCQVSSVFFSLVLATA